MLRPTIKEILSLTGVKGQVIKTEKVQDLWSGYGEIIRVHLEGGEQDSVVIKIITPPSKAHHPRNWNTTKGHERKLQSYQVEKNWYTNFSHKVTSKSPVPIFIGEVLIDDIQILVLGDLNGSGYDQRKNKLTQQEVRNCLIWLANFHATFINESPFGLWETGTYWHLETRPDEFKAMTNTPLKNTANEIDNKLNSCVFKTFVHGDAKLANFCFSKKGNVAAVDFQYVGGGCGMKDVVYFLSCFDERLLEEHAESWVAFYFDQLESLLAECEIDTEALISEWKEMYCFCWADFERFLHGWSPGHKKLSTYSNIQVVKAIEALDQRSY